MIETLWTDSEGNHFEVVAIDHSPNGSRVYYKKVGTDQRYDCLLDAFKQRFTCVENSK